MSCRRSRKLWHVRSVSPRLRNFSGAPINFLGHFLVNVLTPTIHTHQETFLTTLSIVLDRPKVAISRNYNAHNECGTGPFAAGRNRNLLREFVQLDRLDYHCKRRSANDCGNLSDRLHRTEKPKSSRTRMEVSYWLELSDCD